MNMIINKIDALEGALEKLKKLLDHTKGEENKDDVRSRIASLEAELDKAYEEENL